MPIFYSPLTGAVELTDERRIHILTAHPDLKPHIKKLSQVLQNPDEIRRSRFDKDVLLFYRYFATIAGGKYINVTVKTGERNFVLTSYITDRIRAGEKYEAEKESL